MIEIIKKIWHIFDSILYKIASAVLGLFKINIPEEKWAGLMQFVKFGMVGVMNTFIDYFAYLIALRIFGALGWFGDMSYIPANFIGLITSVTNAFYWNDRYVFKKEKGAKRSKFRSYIKTVSSYAITGLGLKTLLLYLLITVLHLPDWLAPIIIMVIVVPVNFFMNKLWAFRSK